MVHVGPPPDREDVLASLSGHRGHLDEWAFASKGLGPDPQLIADAWDRSTATMLIEVDGFQLVGITQRLRSRDQTATLRLLPVDHQPLSTLGPTALHSIVHTVRARLLLRKLYLYAIDPAIREQHKELPPVESATLHHEGCLLNAVIHHGALVEEDVFAAYSAPVDQSPFKVPDRAARPQPWEPVPLPHVGLQGARSTLTPLADGDVLWLYEHETTDDSWAELGTGVAVSEYAASVRDAAPIAFAIREPQSPALLGRVSVFDWQPFLRRARLSVFFSPTLTPSQRFAAGEGMFLAVLHAMNHLGLETLCLDSRTPDIPPELMRVLIVV